jgi:hypothetical protein
MIKTLSQLNTTERRNCTKQNYLVRLFDCQGSSNAETNSYNRCDTELFQY